LLLGRLTALSWCY